MQYDSGLLFSIFWKGQGEKYWCHENKELKKDLCFQEAMPLSIDGIGQETKPCITRSCHVSFVQMALHSPFNNHLILQLLFIT